MIIVYAGVQADERNRPSPRLPEAAEELLRSRVRGLFESLQPRVVVGAAASGSDLIIAEAARLEGAPLRLLLPFSREEFSRTSVCDRGERWERTYDRLLDQTQEKDIVFGSGDPDDEDVYFHHNQVMLDDALAIAQTGERVWALAVRPQPAGHSSVTDDFVARAEQLGLLVLDLDPLAARPRGFIAMPYGLRRDPVSRVKFDCDPAFHRIYRPIMEDLDVAWVRADLETDTGIIHVGMIDDLANSDIVIADLSTSNFNVAYEIGLRHVFAPSTTVLVNPEFRGAKRRNQPFDVNPIRAHGFKRDVELTDLDAETAIRALRRIVADVLRKKTVDSPVHEFLKLDHLARPFARRSAEGAVGSDQVTAELAARRRVADALRSSSAKTLLAAAQELTADALVPADARAGLAIQLAAGLVRESTYEDAVTLLEGIRDWAAPANGPELNSPLRRLWLQQLAMAHRRIGEQEQTPQADRDAHLSRATELLAAAVQEGYGDSETYGILGGLTKRKLRKLSFDDDRGEFQAAFRKMEEYYRQGFESDPTYYTGVNLVMALRLRLQRLDPDSDDEADNDNLDEVLSVTKFLTRRAIEHDQADLWAAFTRAELMLHESLLRSFTAAPAIREFRVTARRARRDHLESVSYQLDFLQHCGDPADVIGAVRAAVSAGAQA